MNSASLYAIAAVLFGMVWLCHYVEKQSRKYYEDRAMFRAQGFFLALALVSLAFAVVRS